LPCPYRSGLQSMALFNFRTGSAFAFVLASLWLAHADSPPIVHYAPVENLEHVDVALLDKAERKIDIAAYVLTDRPVMSALIRAAGRGVKVRVYMGAKQFGGEQIASLLAELMACPGIEVRLKHAGAPLMHLKSYEIDGRLLRTGAANFSASGLKRQDNDLLVIESPAAAEAFGRRFDAMFAQGEAPLSSAQEQFP
jgi:phosphatidylserine/phosphatidylglycerophosphate/cardiolipin synthase-like enzyme